jgi:hypothetical protein
MGDISMGERSHEGTRGDWRALRTRVFECNSEINVSVKGSARRPTTGVGNYACASSDFLLLASRLENLDPLMDK